VSDWFVPCAFKDATVLARCDSAGKLRVHAGKVAIRYTPGGKEYSTFPDRLVPSGEAPRQLGGGAGPTGGLSRQGEDSAVVGGTAADLDDASHLHLWADGACSGNPGPAGAGTVLVDGARRVEASTWLGTGTNNIAELAAIGAGLDLLGEPPRSPARTVVIHTDSQYAIGVLGRGWKAKANAAQIAELKQRIERLPRVVWHWVRGHNGLALNERVDALARAAIAGRQSTRREVAS
jgi:ribonuclease HI